MTMLAAHPITVAELHRAGITASLSGERLRLDAEPGALTAGLRERITASRGALLRELSEVSAITAHLLRIASDAGLPARLVGELPIADLLACQGESNRALRAYLHALAARQHMDAGKVPAAWGEDVARTCEGCGPVLLWDEAPAHVLACPWCWNRQAGQPVPRPDMAA